MVAGYEVPGCYYRCFPVRYLHAWNTYARQTISGAETTLSYQLTPDARTLKTGFTVVLRLPPRDRKAAPQLAGILHDGSSFEAFLTSMDPETHDSLFEHHVEVYRGEKGTTASLVHDFKLLGGPKAIVSFFDSPDRKDSPDVLIDVMGGAYWGTTYLLSPDRTAIQQAFESSAHDFADLDRDGLYELISWQRRPNDTRCKFGIMGVRLYPEVFVRTGWQFHRVWPPAAWSGVEHQIVGDFAGLNGDNHGELVVLSDRVHAQPASHSPSISSPETRFIS